MAVREIVRIDEEKCTGCGLCVPACAEGAIEIVDGKARLVAENLCDGLGACLGECPEDAIIIERRDADAFDAVAVEDRLKEQSQAREKPPAPGGCPGARVMQFDGGAKAPEAAGAEPGAMPSELQQWPIQLHLVPPVAPFFQEADVLLAADCVAFSRGDFHHRLLKGKGLAVACPKLDSNQEIYQQKLVAMIDQARINTLTVAIMEVPCCGGLLNLAQQAVAAAQRKIPVKLMVVSLQGEIREERWL
jgi:NAD-dependent dihydropyrimidine dehydrogenase PreA subunit